MKRAVIDGDTKAHGHPFLFLDQSSVNHVGPPVQSDTKIQSQVLGGTHLFRGERLEDKERKEPPPLHPLITQTPALI